MGCQYTDKFHRFKSGPEGRLPVNRRIPPNGHASVDGLVRRQAESTEAWKTQVRTRALDTNNNNIITALITHPSLSRTPISLLHAHLSLARPQAQLPQAQIIWEELIGLLITLPEDSSN